MYSWFVEARGSLSSVGASLSMSISGLEGGIYRCSLGKDAGKIRYLRRAQVTKRRTDVAKVRL